MDAFRLLSPRYGPGSGRAVRRLAIVLPAFAVLFLFLGRALLPSAHPGQVFPFKSDQVDAYLILETGAARPPLAHYIEHLAWIPNVGPKSRPENRDTNASTSTDSIVYWFSGKPEDLPDLVRKLATVFKPIALPREFAEQEREIILREYDFRVTNRPDVQAASALEAFLFEGTRLAASPIGTPDQIRAMSLDEAKALHAATHRPELARLVVTGHVSESEVRDAAKAAGLPGLTASPRQFVPPPLHLGSPASRTLTYPDPAIAPRMFWNKVVALPEPVDFDRLVFECALLRDLLDTDLPGGLAGPLRFEAFIAKSFAIDIQPLDGRHVLLAFAGEPDKGVSFAQLQTAFETTLAASARGTDPGTYDRVRQRFKDIWPDWSDEDATARWMAGYAVNRLVALREPKSRSELRSLDGSINRHDINRLLAALVGPGRTAIALLGKDSTR